MIHTDRALSAATGVRKSNASIGAWAVIGRFAFFALFAVENPWTAAAADGQSASGLSPDTGGGAGKIEPQITQRTQMGLS
jgi:hypothetical protein